MAASPEDIRTVKTIVESIQSVIDRLTTRAISRAAEQECFEFMELLVHAIEADLHPGRVGTLMFTDQIGEVHPFNALACLMHPQLALSAKLRCVATKTFKSLFNAVTSRECAPYLSTHAAEAVQELDIVPLMIQTIIGQHVDPEEMSAASELLFVLVMQLPKVRDSLAVTRTNADPWVQGGSAGSGVGLLIRVLAQSLMIRSSDDLPSGIPADSIQHIVAILRVVSDLHADAFIARELFFLPIVTTLMEREWSRIVGNNNKNSQESAENNSSHQPGSPNSILTLLLEIVGEIVLHFPSFYRMNILRPAGAHPSSRDATVFTITIPPSLSVNLPRRFCNLLAECANHSSDQDLKTAAAAAIHQIFAIEGSDGPLSDQAARDNDDKNNDNDHAKFYSQPVMRALFEDRERWNKAISEAGTGPSFQVDRLRLQRSLVTSAITNTSISNIEKIFMEVFPALCVLLDSSRSSKEPMREAALIVSLMCAKCPQIRRNITAMVTGFEQWALRLRGTVCHILSKQGEDALTGILVVDLHQCLLNDGEQLMPLDSINYEKVAAALLTEQERRMTAAQPVVPFAGDLLESSRLWPKRAHDVAARLALSLMMEATSVALVPHHRSLPPDQASPVAQTAEGIANKLLGVRGPHQNQHYRDSSSVGNNQHEQQVPSMLGHDSPSTMMSATTPNARNNNNSRRTIEDHYSVPGIHEIHVGEQNRSDLMKTPRGGGVHASASTKRRVSTPVSSARPGGNHNNQTQSRSRQFLALFGDAPDQKQKTPFRPASNSTRLGGFVQRSGQASRKRGSGRDGEPSTLNRRSLVEALKIDAVESDDAFVSLALMMHLPITYGVHYNRAQKQVIRSVHDPKRPQGPWVTPVFRETQHTWSINDIMEGDLYVLFVPFHKLTVDRLRQEVMSVERHMLAIRKQLILTPQQQRTRRWFLNDMINFILPKTDLMLRDFISLLESFTVEDVIYQMGVIRLMDEKQRESENVVQLALEVVDAAMPNELLRFSSGRLRDVLHSGNISYAVRRLREHYQGISENQSRTEGVPGEQDQLNVGDSEHQLAAAHRRPGGQPSNLNEIDREIATLEKKMASSNWGHNRHQDPTLDDMDLDDEDNDDDDVESVFDNLQQRADRQPMTAAERRQAAMNAQFDGGKVVRDGIDSGVESASYPDRYLASSEPPQVASSSGQRNQQNNNNNNNGLHSFQQATGIPASNFQEPGEDEFNAMYSAVEAQSRR